MRMRSQARGAALEGLMVTNRWAGPALGAALLLALAACGSSSGTPDLSFPSDADDAVETAASEVADGLTADDGIASPDAADLPDVDVAGEHGGETGGEMDDDAIDGSTDDVTADGADAPENPFYESPELFLRILGPTDNHFAASGGSLTSVTGLLFGHADSITWTSPKGTGSIEPGGFWLSDAIELDPGDNLIEVKAVQGTKVATDHIVIVYTPGFMFSRLPQAVPDVAFAGESVSIVFTMRVSANATVDGSIALFSTKADGAPDQQLGVLKDDGNLGSSGDEISDDGVYTYRSTLKCTTEGVLRYRVGVPVKTGVSSYVAYSAPVAVECLQHLSAGDCHAAVDTQKAAATLYDTKKKDVGEAAARKAVLDYLSAAAPVKAAGLEKDGYGVWAQYKSGVLGVLSLAPAGLRAGGDGEGDGGDASVTSAVVPHAEIASKRAVVFAPYATEFGSDDESTAIGTSLTTKVCPSYDVSGPHLGPQSTLAKLRDAMGAGIVSIATHADTFFTDLPQNAKDGYGWAHSGSQEVMFLGEPVNCDGLLSSAKTCSGPNTCPGGTECVITAAQGTSLSGVCVDRTQADLKRGRAAVGNGTFAVLPTFIDRYARDGMPDSIVYLGGCRTAYNGTLIASLIGAGAKVVGAYTGYVGSAFAGDQGRAFFQNLIDKGLDTGPAFPTDVEDLDHPGSKFLLIGATDLTATASLIVNEGFERGDLTGWTREGDGRVISQLGITKPVSAKFMAVISSGLGYTVSNGLIEQTFCIPAGTYGFSFYWKFYSEEFHEFCGSQFQDTFQAKFVNKLGQELVLVDLAVDDLCDPGDCSGCCEKGLCVGLVPSDVEFDMGDAHVVPKWQKAKVDVSQFSDKGPITLSFFITDKGDSIYDTVVLIDALKFQ